MYNIFFLFQEMLDSVGIRLPKYKVRELTLELQRTGEIQDDTVDKMMFLQVNFSLRIFFCNIATNCYCQYKLIKHDILINYKLVIEVSVCQISAVQHNSRSLSNKQVF